MEWETFFRKNLEPVQAYQPGLREEQIRQIVEVDTIYKLSSNESPLPPFPSAITAMQQHLSALNEYSDASSYHLTCALSRHYGVPFEQIVTGNGSNELIDLIAMTCLDPGDNVVYGWPSFIVYRSSAQIAGAEWREVPLTSGGSFDLEALLAAIDERTKVVTICTPNNPTGGAVSAAALEDFLKRVPPHVLVILDAAYEEFIDDAQAAKPLAYFDGQRPYVVLRTFSKAYALAGLRCGYGFAPTALVEMLHRVREPFNVNTLAQVAARACLGDTEELARRYALNLAGKQRLYACFEALGLRYLPTQANFVWVDVPDAATAFDALLKKGIIVRPFPGTEGLRIGVGDEKGVEATIAAFQGLFGI
jgi:histidinol-phosphate aminotransferase